MANPVAVPITLTINQQTAPNLIKLVPRAFYLSGVEQGRVKFLICSYLLIRGIPQYVMSGYRGQGMLAHNFKRRYLSAYFNAQVYN